jgi:aminotransferase
MKREYRRRRELVLDGLKNIGLDCVKPDGAFYVFPSIKKTGLSSLEFAKRLLKEEKVALVPGTAFGKNFDGFVRISYAASTENLKEALSRISNFVKKIRR